MSGKKMILGCFFVALVFGSAALLHAQTYVDADGCSHAAGNVPVTLTSGDGFKTYLKVPRAYYDPRYDFSQNTFISIQSLVNDMKPICYTADYATKDDKAYIENVVDFQISSSIPIGFSKTFKRKLEQDYPDFVGKEGSFSVYRSKEAIEEHLTKGFDEFLVSNGNVFSKPSFIICSRPGFSVNRGERTRCSVNQQYNDHVWLKYYFDSNYLSDVEGIDRKVDQFMRTLIVNKPKNNRAE